MQLSGIDVIFKGVNLQRLMGGLIVTGQIALVSIVLFISSMLLDSCLYPV